MSSFPRPLHIAACLWHRKVVLQGVLEDFIVNRKIIVSMEGSTLQSQQQGNGFLWGCWKGCRSTCSYHVSLVRVEFRGLWMFPTHVQLLQSQSVFLIRYSSYYACCWSCAFTHGPGAKIRCNKMYQRKWVSYQPLFLFMCKICFLMERKMYGKYGMKKCIFLSWEEKESKNSTYHVQKCLKQLHIALGRLVL